MKKCVKQMCKQSTNLRTNFYAWSWFCGAHCNRTKQDVKKLAGVTSKDCHPASLSFWTW